MSKNKTLFILSIVLIVLPFLGLPKSFEDWVVPIIGLFLLSLSYFYVREIRMGKNFDRRKEKTEHVFFDQTGEVVGVDSETNIEIVEHDEKVS